MSDASTAFGTAELRIYGAIEVWGNSCCCIGLCAQECGCIVEVSARNVLMIHLLGCDMLQHASYLRKGVLSAATGRCC